MKPLAVAALIAALHPPMTPSTRTAYARELAADPDPATLVALVEHEARWQPSAVGGLDGECIGLGQRCLRFDPACAWENLTPDVQSLGSTCAARRAALLDGRTALRELVAEARAWRRFCWKTVRSSAPRAWLAGYSGADGHGVTCGRRRVHGRWRDVKVPKLVFDILSIRKRILGGLNG